MVPSDNSLPPRDVPSRTRACLFGARRRLFFTERFSDIGKFQPLAHAQFCVNFVEDSFYRQHRFWGPLSQTLPKTISIPPIMASQTTAWLTYCNRKCARVHMTQKLIKTHSSEYKNEQNKNYSKIMLHFLVPFGNFTYQEKIIKSIT